MEQQSVRQLPPQLLQLLPGGALPRIKRVAHLGTEFRDDAGQRLMDLGNASG
jgi:hypothetical protein